MRINMGPQHPSTHGVLRLEVELDGEIVTEVVPHIGYLHRCFEKSCEKMSYPQVIPYIDRMDYISSMNNELPFVMGMEKLLGINIPERIDMIRVALCELNRIANHQIAVATFGLDCGAFTPFLYLFRDREMILNLFEAVSGGRLLYNYFWIGGLMNDVPPSFKENCLDIIKTVRVTNEEVMRLLIGNKIFEERTANVGILPADVAVNFGVSGPVLRGSGVDYDIRRSEPYSMYDKLDFDVIIGKGEIGTLGDCFDRNIVRMREMEESCKIIEQIISVFPDESSDVRALVPRRVKPPKGEIYSKAENPKGELGFYIVSDGSVNPYRMRSRATSFVNLSVLPEISKGYMIADLIMILGSLDIVLGEIDR
ncbi:MAG: NADH-quinone oxidoreductase subunit D [Candidatus Kapabacteria bacterium]|nr:NADH-quinone oxidoreductase subunit D [Candidatus Kapabacteria bacterium]